MILSELEDYIDDDFLVVGVGNELKNFDRAGIEIARRGREIYPDKFIDCGVTPENYLDKIINRKVKTLVIIDTVYFTERDDVRIILPEQLSLQGISTHSSSLTIVSEYLNNWGIKTLIIGIKPEPADKLIGVKVLNRLVNLIEKKGVK
ncbi:hypothetical protein KAX02_07645 [candidate division WOR-3 bacterium]|nr:hypothetical protein [candidate division WOR-3 bacterium]